MLLKNVNGGIKNEFADQKKLNWVIWIQNKKYISQIYRDVWMAYFSIKYCWRQVVEEKCVTNIHKCILMEIF